MSAVHVHLHEHTRGNHDIHIYVHTHILSLSLSMNTLGVSVSTIHITQVRLFRILAALIHHTQPDQQHSSKFLPYIIYTLDKKENEVRMYTLPKQLHRKHSSLSTAVFYFLFMNACTYGDLGDSGTLGKTIHKLK